MLRYVFVLLLINAYSGSLGAPSNSLSVLLTKLTKRCENSFVVAQIENKILECNLSESNMKKQFECLIFYDINSQLCSAISQSKLNITEDYIQKVNEKYDVIKLCEIAKDWTFTKISEKYLENVKLVFQNAIKCASVCEVEDFTKDDAIFYCKYYNWGWQLLKSQEKAAAQTTTNPSGTQAVNETSAVAAKIDETHVNIDNIDIQVKDGSTSTKMNEVKTELAIDKTMLAKTDDVKNDNSDSDGQVSTEKKLIPEVISNAPEKVDQHNEVVKVTDNTIKTSEKIESEKNAPENPPAVPIPAETSNAVPQADMKKDEGTNDMLNQLENPKIDDKPNDPVDYQGNDLDSEEGKEGLPDTQGNDDGEDPGLSDLDLKPEHDDKASAKRINSPIYPFNGEISERETYSSTIQEGFTEDDDHFFPFFLTAVILVVLLYVLYHNKNKVLGLIVEGRQPGRRRNSRGHAYRRLDTLEQAMSGNLAAPPSKIIY
ncbi:uncharacterized protein ACR2FA_011863 isoform 2-T2 [Aphomia sociella]